MTDKYTLQPTNLGTPKDDFEFRFNGRKVGRTYATTTPNGVRWYWSIYGINLRGPLPEGVAVQGLANDLDEAKAAFKENWESCWPQGRRSRKKSHINRTSKPSGSAKWVNPHRRSCPSDA